MRPASPSNRVENGSSAFNGVLNSTKRPKRVEAVGKPVCGWELVGSRLMRFAEIDAGCQARIASINGLTPRIAITRFML